MIRAGTLPLYALLVMVSSVVTLVLCEVTLRGFSPQPLYTFQRGLFVSDPRVGYRLAPSKDAWHNNRPDYSYQIHTNTLGFRGPEPKQNAAVRVLLLGDSFGFGQGVTEGRTLADLARAHFTARQLDFDLLNTSVPGYAPINEKAILEEVLPVYLPHLVLLLFYWNDVAVQESLKVKDGYLVLSEGLRLGWLRQYLNNYSHLYALVKKSYFTLIARPHSARAIPSFRPDELDQTATQVREILALCDRYGALFRVLITPVGGVGAEDALSKRTKQEFFQRLAAYRIPYLDLQDTLSNVPEAQRWRLVFPHDGHWNEAGHAYFVRPIIQVIEEAVSTRAR